MDTEDSGNLVRLQRLLAMAGAGSRRHCEEYITTGRVTVDGKTITELGARVDPDAQDVRLDGERLKINRRSYYMLNKPTGVLCTNRDPQGRTRVQDLFPKGHERLFTVGRLDENSQGLLLVTNDGELAHRMAHPRFEVEKTYRVQVAGIPSREIVAQLEQGMYFSEGRFAAKSARLLKSKGQSAVLEIVLTEGQNREIRRLLARVGHKVQRLTRVGLGPLRLGELPLGQYRRLAPQEVHQLEQLSQGGRRGGKRSAKSGSGRSKPGPRGRSDRESQQAPRAGGRGAGPRGKSRGDRRGPAPGRAPAAGRSPTAGRRASAARGPRPTEASRPPQDEEVFITRRRPQPSGAPVDDIEKSLFGQRAGRDSEDELTGGGGGESQRPRGKRSKGDAASPRRKPGGSPRRREDDDLPEA
jgi:23S rRNA pseudouridine2605 synthase